MKMKSLSLLILLCIAAEVTAQSIFPGKTWMQYQSVSDAGFEPTKLDSVVSLHRHLKGAALLIVYRGAIVMSLGEPSRKFMDHSMRKSYLSALFGILHGRDAINLNESLLELGIDDIHPLSDEEKKATVGDLLSARSGVYHPAAYSPRGMKERMPVRGSHEHGTFWYYNNWDFNALASIYEKKSKRSLFDSFNDEMAIPLGMEDFAPAATFYRREPELSLHPAYLFRLSARDEARFGLLFLNQGKWSGKQIIPAHWVEKSTSPISVDLTGFDQRDGYGYLWWTTSVNGINGFYASGAGGQRIAVFPSREIVIVQSSNTYDGALGIDDAKIDGLIRLILESQTTKAKANPKLKGFACEPRSYPNFTIDASRVDAYCKTFMHRFLGAMTIEHAKGRWSLKTNVGIFILHPKSHNEFIPEDIETSIIMEKAENSNDAGTIIPVTAPDKSLLRIRFLY